MKTAVIIAAAGVGRRMGGLCPKQYLELGKRPIICHTLDRFQEARGIDELVCVVEPGREKSFSEEILKAYGYPKNWIAVAGGQVRQESITNGLKTISTDCDVVLVHDAVRPFISAEQIELTARVSMRDGACIVASPIRETIKRTDSDGYICETVDRKQIWGAQTPQGFARKILSDAISRAQSDGYVGTDDASIVERMGVKITIIEGDSRNIKITTPSDMAIAEAILEGWNTV